MFRMREPYFNGKNITWKYRNPWKNATVLNGTDALTFHPDVNPDETLGAYLDDIYRTCSFIKNGTKNYHKLNSYRYV